MCADGVAHAVQAPKALREVVQELTQHWREHPDSDFESAGGTSSSERTSAAATNVAQPECIELDDIRKVIAQCDSRRASASCGRRALCELLATTLKLEGLVLGNETLRSCCVRLESRTDFLNTLKELGVSAIPHRQKIANAVSKAKRLHTPQLAPPQPPPPPHPSLPLPPPTGEPQSTISICEERLPVVRFPSIMADGAELQGLLLTADGRAYCIGDERAARPSAGHSVSGAVLRLVRQLLPLAAVHAFVPSSRSAPCDREALVQSLGSDNIVVLRAIRHCSSVCPPPSASSPSLDVLLGTLDQIAARRSPDEAPTVRVQLGKRASQATWRGARPRSASETSLRCRLVHHCADKPQYDVAFVKEPRRRSHHELCRGRGGGDHVNAGEAIGAGAGGAGAGDARPLSRLQQARCRVALLVDSANGWDAGWSWALSSGCVLVHVGVWLPPISQLEAWVHYVPAATDLSDLDERVQWALSHSDALLMAARCRQLYDELSAADAASRALVHSLARLSAATQAADGGTEAMAEQ